MGKLKTLADLYKLQANEEKLFANNTKTRYTPYSKHKPGNEDEGVDSLLMTQTELLAKYECKNIPLHQVHGYQQKSVDNIYHSINQRKHLPFNKFMYGLGLRYVGEKFSLEIAKKFGIFDTFWKLACVQCDESAGKY